MPPFNDTAPALSVVAPCYNEVEGLQAFYDRTRAACEAVSGDDYEIVLVDDGSSDGTWAMIHALSLSHRQVVGVKLRRNHGHQLAATAGLFVSRGRRVMLIDADLQDPPELLTEMMARMDQGANVVYGKRKQREGETWFKLVSAAMFYRLLSRLSKVDIPRDTGDFRLMDRTTVNLLNNMPEHHRFIRGMVSWIGGRQVALEYEREARFAGMSKYPLRKMIRFAIDAITSFSSAPLRFSAWAGVGAASLAFIMLIYTLVQWARHSSITGWSSLMTAITFFSGCQLLMLGTIGEYLGRLVEENKGRPLFMIDQISSADQQVELTMRAAPPKPVLTAP